MLWVQFRVAQCATPAKSTSSPVPALGEKAENFASFRQEVELHKMVTPFPLNRRAPALALAVGKMPRELCLALGTDVSKLDVGAEKVTETLHQNIAPDAYGRHIAIWSWFWDFVALI